jgi:hypothetical protein
VDFNRGNFTGSGGTYFGKIQAVAGNFDFKREPDEHADIAGG